MNKLLFLLLLFYNSIVLADNQAIVGYTYGTGQYQPYGAVSGSIAGIVVTTAIAIIVIDALNKNRESTITSPGPIYTEKLLIDPSCNCLKLFTVQIQ